MARRAASEFTDVSAYLMEIGRFKLLSRVEEQYLSRAYLDGDEDAGRKLIEANLRLVVNVARRFQGRNLPLADLIQAGNEGLLRAVKKFDPDRGNKFSTYAMWWIYQGIRRSLHTNSRLIDLPLHASELVSKSYISEQRLIQHLGRQPTEDEVLAHDLSTLRKGGVSAKQYKSALGRSRAGAILSLDERPIGENGSDPTSRGSMLAGEYEDPSAGTSFVKDEIMLLVRRLPPRAKFVITRRYGIDGGAAWTLQEVAAHLEISRERVRQIEVLAIKILRRLKDEPSWRPRKRTLSGPVAKGWPKGTPRCPRCRCEVHTGRCKR